MSKQRQKRHHAIRQRICVHCGQPYQGRHPEMYCGDKCRLLSRVIESANGCWEWQGYIGRNGYGQVQVRSEAFGGSSLKAHRVAFTVWNGPIPDDLLVCHRCDNRCCINPAHLFLGTAKENTADMVSKGRTRKSGFPRPTLRKLSREQVEMIRVDPRTHRTIAASYGVAPRVIAALLSGVTYKDW